MAESFNSPLRRIERREGDVEYLECGHEQKRRRNNAMRRRCIQCRRSRVTGGCVTVTERQEATEGTRCPYCFDDFSDDTEETWNCEKCRTKLHRECHDELGTCTTLGCKRMVVHASPRPMATAAVDTFATIMNQLFSDPRTPVLLAVGIVTTLVGIFYRPVLALAGVMWPIIIVTILSNRRRDQ